MLRNDEIIRLIIKRMYSLHKIPRALRCLVLLTIAIAVCTGGLAQEITVSEEIYLKNDNDYSVIGKVEDRILLFREMQNQFEVHGYDEDMRLLWERVLDFEKRNADIIAVLPGDTSFHVVYGYRLKGEYFVKHHHYDPDVFLLDTTTLCIVEKSYFSPKFEYTHSEDRSKVLIFRTDKESELFAQAYDLNQRETLWEKDIHFPNGNFRRDFIDMVVTDKGDMFVILDPEKASRRNQEFVIMRLNSRSKVLATKTVDLGELIAFDVFMKYDNLNEQLMITGLYNDRNNDKLKGIYLATLGRDAFKPEVRTVLFSEDLLSDVHGKDVKLKKGLPDFSIQDIVLRRDGGALLIAEMNKEYSRRPNMPIRRDVTFGRTGWVDYYYEDIVLYSIHPDGTIHWNKVLHKKQYSQDDQGMYSSYFLFKNPEKIRLIFNDEIRHENTISEYIVRGNGYFKRSSVFSTDYQRLRLRFRDGVQVAYNECIVPSERNNRLNLVRIRYEN